MGEANGKASDLKAGFVQIYSQLKSELLEDPAFSFTEDSRQWIDRMLDYNVPGGKLNRGISVVDSFEILKGSQLCHDEFFRAGVLGWCVEWLQAYFLVLDDMMDNSYTRRGQPCWFRLPEVEFQTASGQMLDLITTHEGKKDLSKYKMPVYNRIVQYKTAYYSFYLPVACALLMAGENLDNYVDLKRVLVEMGTYFQVQDDYLDCFGDPSLIGKIGTDIEDFKCSWLIVQALEIADENQLKFLEENYGNPDPACVAKVKSLYNDLNLQAKFSEYERSSYEQLISSIEAQPSKQVQEVLKSFLHKIYKRQK
ncbi:farnesyl pyrophosphate synthase 1-like isoform X2 [Phalaenopsis equestris]|uniref:farnesyl pyrophosphate synthase 1-like isoform X2 n=1 Tax=Phalaenopsis equestris TaxID=78828 RepID=UPI0009E51B87|nr:farnesyl pyrophosphate synthase 1-like isoform X2 [Phalaenopsis equestris]